MNREQIVQWFAEDAENEKVEWDFFDKLPAEKKLHPSERISGILKLTSLMKKPDAFDFGAEHDEVNFYVGPRDLVDTVTEDDLMYLEGCGIHYSREDDAFYMFC